MKYIALLRGINVGGNHKVEMKKLKDLFESMGFSDVATYINSGNIMFDGKGRAQDIREDIEQRLEERFGFAIPTLVKTAKEMQRIADAIPEQWQNDSAERTDVAYLFPEINSKNILDNLPLQREYIDVRHIRGALFWNVRRDNVYRSRLHKLISHTLYHYMTVRNVNTARYLGYVGRGTGIKE